jgi:AcrR family transcriptional regulator
MLNKSTRPVVGRSTLLGMATQAPKRMTRDGRRANLVAAAARAVIAQPGERLTFDAVAAEAGVSATLPYKYFDSIEDVTLELYTATVADVDATTDELLADPDRSFDDKVRGAFLLWCDQVERDDFLFVRLAEGANATGLARAVHRRRERIVQVWAEQIGAEFELDTSTARLVSASVTAGASALVQRVFTDRLDREMVADRLVELARAQGEAAQ